ncbi:MAG: cation-translocating P-type ATPase C-terminal domain-containing protein, partial [Candidatus Riflemargulisbacteria bacterium]
LHVVLLELVIDPTCSIVLERTPAEPNIMDQKPIPQGQPLVNKAIVIKSLIQGLIIFAATFGTYLYIWLGCKAQAESAHLIGDNLKAFLENGAVHARTMAFVILIVSNLLLVLVNSSEFHSIITCAKNLFKEKLIIIINSGIILIAILAVYTPLATYLKFTALEPLEMLCALGISIVAVLWYEIVKLVKNRGTREIG